MIFDFYNKDVVVTGGASGIGKAISILFAKLNARVTIIDMSENNIELLYKNFHSIKYTNFNIIKCDIANKEDINESFDKIIKFTNNNIDFLINNAGITRDSLFMRMSYDYWNDVINVNLNGIFNVTKLFIPIMLKKRYGRIINISSVIGLTGNAGQVNYATSKAGIIGFTKSIAREFASRNINCNAIAPGYIDTPMTDVLSDDIKNNILSIIPMKKLGKCDDVANLVCFLCSKYSDYITGQTINVDGGMVMF